MTSSKELYATLCRRCPGEHEHPEHAECRGACAQASAYYPQKLCLDAVKALKYQWSKEAGGLVRDTEQKLLNVAMEDWIENEDQRGDFGTKDPATENVLALTRVRLNLKEAPTGRRLEEVKQAMMRVRRASGHSGFSNLKRLLEARGAPRWAIELAGTLRCPECEEASKPRPAPPASIGVEPSLFEILGADVFEYEEDATRKKYKIALWRDRASGLTFLDILKEFESRESWEPTTTDMIRSFCKWLSSHPPPTWVMTDSAPYFTSTEFMDFCGRSGIGHTVAPAEAHWLMGSEESAISMVRSTVDRLRRELRGYSVETLMNLATHAMNCHVGPSGYSAFQWVHGQDHFSDPPLPPGLDPRLAMEGLLQARDKARLCFEKEKAKEKFSKLNNAKTRPPVNLKAGQLCMLWRQRIKPGKVKGSWVGPFRPHCLGRRQYDLVGVRGDSHQGQAESDPGGVQA